MSLTQQQLESMLWGAAEHLRGQIDASDYKQYIFPLLFYKRLSDVYQDEYEEALKFSDGDQDYAQLPEQHRFIIPESARWEKLRETATNIGAFIQKALRSIEKNNTRLYGVFGDAQWTNKERLPDHLLASLVGHYYNNGPVVITVNQLENNSVSGETSSDRHGFCAVMGVAGAETYAHEFGHVFIPRMASHSLWSVHVFGNPTNLMASGSARESSGIGLDGLSLTQGQIDAAREKIRKKGWN